MKNIIKKSIGLLMHNQTPLWISVAVLAGSVGYSAYVADGARRVEVLKIQQTLRERYLAYKLVLDSLRIRDYPSKVASYTQEERYQLSRYWSEIQFNEFLTLKKFGRGVLKNEWSGVYGVWAVNALEDYQVLREEFCHFLKTEQGTMGIYAQEFEDVIREEYSKSNPNKTINCESLLEIRKKRTKETKV